MRQKDETNAEARRARNRARLLSSFHPLLLLLLFLLLFLGLQPLQHLVDLFGIPVEDRHQLEDVARGGVFEINAAPAVERVDFVFPCTRMVSPEVDLFFEFSGLQARRRSRRRRSERRSAAGRW